MNATTTIIENRHPITNDSKISKQVKFVLCSHCFWNASLLGREVDRICPSCKGSTINSMPLARNVRALIKELAAQNVKNA